MFQPTDLLSVSLRALEFLVLDRSLRRNNSFRKMVNKTVIRLEMKDCDKCKKIALQSVAKIVGIDSLSINMEDCTLTVIGEADPVFVAKTLRRKFRGVEIVSLEQRLGYAHIEVLSLGKVEGEKKKEEKKDDEKKKPPEKTPLKGRGKNGESPSEEEKTKEKTKEKPQ